MSKKTKKDRTANTEAPEEALPALVDHTPEDPEAAKRTRDRTDRHEREVAFRNRLGRALAPFAIDEKLLLVGEIVVTEAIAGAALRHQIAGKHEIAEGLMRWLQALKDAGPALGDAVLRADLDADDLPF